MSNNDKTTQAQVRGQARDANETARREGQRWYTIPAGDGPRSTRPGPTAASESLRFSEEPLETSPDLGSAA